MSTWALRSSFLLHSMNSAMSGWSMFRMTILAARRVLPPLLMTPAKASKPFMKLTGPEAMPPPESASLLPRRVEKFVPVPEPHLNNMPSVLAKSMRSEEHTSELQSRLHLVCRLLLEKKKNKDRQVSSFGKKHRSAGAAELPYVYVSLSCIHQPLLLHTHLVTVSMFTLTALFSPVAA